MGSILTKFIRKGDSWSDLVKALLLFFFNKHNCKYEKKYIFESAFFLITVYVHNVFSFFKWA